MSEKALAALILRHQEKTKDSFRAMAARADAAGHEISHSQLQQYARGNVRKPPTRPMVDGIAAAINLPQGQVLRAMLQDYYGVAGIPTVTVLPDGILEQIDTLRETLAANREEVQPE